MTDVLCTGIMGSVSEHLFSPQQDVWGHMETWWNTLAATLHTTHNLTLVSAKKCTQAHTKTHSHSKKLFEKNEIIEGQSREKLRSRKASMSKKFVLPVLLTSIILLKCLNKRSWLKKKKRCGFVTALVKMKVLSLSCKEKQMCCIFRW